MGPNQLLYDFGVTNVEDDIAVQKKIEEIDETFHLVMILENFQVVHKNFQYEYYYKNL